MIALVGFMGAGKTTVGRLLAARLGRAFIDTDDVVERRAGMTVAEIFRIRGEPAFRELEREAVLEALEAGDAVVAIGGGALGDPLVRTAVQRAQIVYLKVSYGVAMRRIGADEGRPMLARDPKALYEQRKPTYERAATFTFEVDDSRPVDLAVEIARRVAGVAAMTTDSQRIVVSLGHRSYDVTVGRELIRRLPEFASKGEAERIFVVYQPALRSRASEVEEAFDDSPIVPHLLEVPDGETAKSLETVGALLDSMAERGATRRDVVVAVGGGVVCDVAGFVSSTYARGVRLILVPTTLLAQVDAAIGGKNGINLGNSKNLVGTFHQPRAVLCDVEVLLSLPREELTTGMAEVIKYGLIADPDLLEIVKERRSRLLEGSAPELIDLVARCASIKAHYVMADEFDTGIRQHLNYGHTFAHAIEAAEDLRGITHGRAVALGMMAAAYLAEDLGWVTEREVEVHRRMLDEFQLPTSADLDLASLERAWKLDKKYRRGVRFVLMRRLGRVEHGVDAPRDAVARAVARLSR